MSVSFRGSATGVFLVFGLLLMVAALDASFLRGHVPGETLEQAVDRVQGGGVVWPERAYRSLVAEMCADPANPLDLSPREQLEARRRIRAMDRAIRRILWSSVRILDSLDAPRLEELNRLHHDLRARALVARHPMPSLAESAVSSLRSRTVDGRLVEAPQPPAGWEPERDEPAARLRWRERTRGWTGEGQDGVDDGGDPPGGDLLEVTPREVLCVLLRLQEEPSLRLQGEESARVAGHVLQIAGSDEEMERNWELLHRLTVSTERTRAKQERQRARPRVDDPSLAELSRWLRIWGRPG